MNLRRFSNVAQSRRSTVLAGWVLVWLIAFGSTGIELTGATPVREQEAPSPSADAERAAAQQLAAIEEAAAALATVPTAAELAAAAAATRTAVVDKPEPAIRLASTDSSEVLPAETPLPATVPAGANPAAGPEPALDSVEVLDECLAVNACIDRYLWALYRRAPKEDSIKVPELRRVTVKRKGKTVTVTRTVTTLVDEDFAWKDPKAADKAGMSLTDYVIGGMDRSFKLKLFHALHAAELAGFAPGITSAFRDDYRQSIASGLKAASNRSFHGGSLRGGYGHGLAADIVSITGNTRDERWASSDRLWKWIDAHGKEFGIARPYLGRDPAHVAPIDGQEYASKRSKTQHVAAAGKKPKQAAVAQQHGKAKRTKSVAAL